MKIGIDIGGTNIRLAASLYDHRNVLVEPVVLPNTADYGHNVAQIDAAIRELGAPVDAIGVCTPGTFSEDDSVMIRSTNMTQWVGNPSINRQLESRFDCPVVKANDTVCGALGEVASRDSTEPFFYVAYGTGIGTAWVNYENGAPKIDRPDDETWLEYIGPWEADCSGAGIEKNFGKSGADLDDDEWKRVTDGFSSHLHTFVEEFRPQEVVLGGGIPIRQPHRLETMMVDFRREHPGQKFTFAALGEKSALVGALALVKEF